MLFNRALHYAFFANSLVNGRKERGFLIVVMLGDTVMPGEAIAHEIHTVGRLYPWSLLIDTVEATDEGIMAQGHMGGLNGEGVRLIKSIRT